LEVHSTVGVRTSHFKGVIPKVEVTEVSLNLEVET